MRIHRALHILFLAASQNNMSIDEIGDRVTAIFSGMLDEGLWLDHVTIVYSDPKTKNIYAEFALKLQPGGVFKHYPHSLVKSNEQLSDRMIRRFEHTRDHDNASAA
jgi:hypothetical protein